LNDLEFYPRGRHGLVLSANHRCTLDRSPAPYPDCRTESTGGLDLGWLDRQYGLGANEMSQAIGCGCIAAFFILAALLVIIILAILGISL
jgi:hypothetical protein